MLFDDSFFEQWRKMQREMDRLFQDLSGPTRPLLPGSEKNLSVQEGYRTPVTDLRETESAFIAAIELPGVSKGDISLNVTDKTIEVRVDRKQESKVEEKGVTRYSAVSRQFYRNFPLPKPVTPKNAEAELRDGILRVTVPKAEAGDSFQVDIR